MVYQNTSQKNTLLSENIRKDSCYKTNALHLGLTLLCVATMLPDITGQSARLSFLGHPGFQFRGCEARSGMCLLVFSIASPNSDLYPLSFTFDLQGVCAGVTGIPVVGKRLGLHAEVRDGGKGGARGPSCP